jgi:hypothetical protein
VLQLQQQARQHRRVRLKDDPRIRVSIEELQAKIPGLAEKMRAGQEFVARDEGTVIRATPKRAGFKILGPATNTQRPLSSKPG